MQHNKHVVGRRTCEKAAVQAKGEKHSQTQDEYPFHSIKAHQSLNHQHAHIQHKRSKIQFFSRDDSKPLQQRIRRVTTGKIFIGKVGWWEGSMAGVMAVHEDIIVQPNGGKHEKREIAEKLNTACLMIRSKQIHQHVHTKISTCVYG